MLLLRLKNWQRHQSRVCIARSGAQYERQGKDRHDFGILRSPLRCDSHLFFALSVLRSRN